MKKQIYLGKNDGDEKIFVTIKIKDTGELTISGVVGPRGDGNATGGCGQIYDKLLSIVDFAEGWSIESVMNLYDIWQRWHLNHMNAGNAEQEKAIREWENSDDYNKRYYDLGYDSWYSMACDYLKSVNLYESNGYRYGTTWVREQLPERIYTWFDSLPETTMLPPRAWID